MPTTRGGNRAVEASKGRGKAVIGKQYYCALKWSCSPLLPHPHASPCSYQEAVQGCCTSQSQRQEFCVQAYVRTILVNYFLAPTTTHDVEADEPLESGDKEANGGKHYFTITICHA